MEVWQYSKGRYVITNKNSKNPQIQFLLYMQASKSECCTLHLGIHIEVRNSGQIVYLELLEWKPRSSFYLWPSQNHNENGSHMKNCTCLDRSWYNFKSQVFPWWDEFFSFHVWTESLLFTWRKQKKSVFIYVLLLLFQIALIAVGKKNNKHCPRQMQHR